MLRDHNCRLQWLMIGLSECCVRAVRLGRCKKTGTGCCFLVFWIKEHPHWHVSACWCFNCTWTIKRDTSIWNVLHVTVQVSCWRKKDEVEALQMLPVKRDIPERHRPHSAAQMLVMSLQHAEVYFCPHKKHLMTLWCSLIIRLNGHSCE